MALPLKVLFKYGGVLTQAADALIWPDEAGFGSDVVRAVDEVVGDAGHMRKLQVTFTRLYAGITEDVAVVTFHFLKTDGTDPTPTWASADMAAVEARMNTWWTAVKPSVASGTTLSQYRWYKSGPAYPISGPPVRVTTVNVAGTGAAVCPPQVSINVSEHTLLRKHWGRFYLPSIAQAALQTNGRVVFAHQTAISGATTTLYNGCRTDGVLPVVFSKYKPARKTKAGVDLPPQAARAYAITSLDVDDVFDVIRSRRFAYPANRVTTTLT